MVPVTVSYWLCVAIVFGALSLNPQELSKVSYWIEFKIRLWFLNRKMERMARKMYAQIQKERAELGLDDLPPFSWKAVERRYGKE